MKFSAPISVIALLLAVSSNQVFGFAPSKATIITRRCDGNKGNDVCRGMPLYMANNQFDISKPVFDLLSLRAVRGDALIRYGALNQSEPLRITLFGLMFLSFLAAPSLTDAVGYDDMSLPSAVGSYAISIGSAGLLLRECSRRARQLNRMEKELNTESLPIRIPTNAFADMPFSKPFTLTQLRQLSAPPRIIAICGNLEKLQDALKGLAIIGQRLQQASVYVVVVPTDGSKTSDWQIAKPASYYTPWLADAYDPGVWREYFDSLSENDTEEDSEVSSFRWFGLNSSGRSFGSGRGEVPLWLQVLGQHLRPTELLDESDKAFSKGTESDNKSLLASLDNFYTALTTGDQAAITKNIFSESSSEQVSQVIEAGGRVDSWKDCLAEGARPQDMQVSGADSIVFSETEAYTTVVEFPANAGIDSATLLAMQKWTRASSDQDWKLELHQTIPWSTEAKAQGTLRCDCRGCVALVRSSERRTFGGMIG